MYVHNTSLWAIHIYYTYIYLNNSRGYVRQYEAHLIKYCDFEYIMATSVYMYLKYVFPTYYIIIDRMYRDYRVIYNMCIYYIYIYIYVFKAVVNHIYVDWIFWLHEVFDSWPSRWRYRFTSSPPLLDAPWRETRAVPSRSM